MASFGLKLLYSQFLVTPPSPTESFTGQSICITGANTGLGFEAAHHVVRLGASTLIIAARDVVKGEAAKQSILKSNPESSTIIHVEQLDLGSNASILAFAERINRNYPRLDAVICNAGIMTDTFKMVEGNESTVTINVISTFLLSLLLLPKLKETAKVYSVLPIISIVTSTLHHIASFSERKASAGSIFENLNDSSIANMADRYNVSKLLEIFILRQWAAEAPTTSGVVTVNGVCPGFCKSSLAREHTDIGFKIFERLMARTTAVGARSLVNAIQQGQNSHGAYIHDCNVEEPSRLVLSEEGRQIQERVWTELMVKLEEIKPGVTANL